MKTKLSVYAPPTPGAKQTVIGMASTLAEARTIAGRFEERRDLKFHDVTIRRGAKIVERCGPAR